MKSERAAQMDAIMARLDSLIDNPTAENAIVPRNNYDESLLIGSPDSYLRLARALVEIVRRADDRTTWGDEELGEETIDGVSVIGSNLIKYPFDELSPVWVMCAYLTSDDSSAKALARKLAERVGADR